MRVEHGRDKELIFKCISKTEWYKNKNLRGSEQTASEAEG